MSTSVLLVDDHELIRTGLAQSFGRRGGFEVVGEAGTVAVALSAWSATRADAVVTDLQLPDGSGLDVVRAVRTASPTTAIVVLTMYAEDRQIFEAMEAGASAFVGKDSPADDVVTAVTHALVSPQTFLCAGLAQAITRRRTAPERPRLSPRETEILGLLADGLRTSDIARRLYLGESTAKTHIARIYDKLGATNRAQALVAAMRVGLLDHVVTGEVPHGTPV